MWTNDEELKEQIAAQLDLIEFLDIVQLTYIEVIDIIFKELNDEQKEELKRSVER